MTDRVERRRVLGRTGPRLTPAREQNLARHTVLELVRVLARAIQYHEVHARREPPDDAEARDRALALIRREFPALRYDRHRV